MVTQTHVLHATSSFFFLKKSFFQMKEGKYVFHYLCKACINVVIILIISKAPCICYFKFVSQRKTSVNFVNMSTFFVFFHVHLFVFSIIMQAYLYFHVIRYFLLIAAFLYHILVYKNDE